MVSGAPGSTPLRCSLRPCVPAPWQQARCSKGTGEALRAPQACLLDILFSAAGTIFGGRRRVEERRSALVLLQVRLVS